MYFRDGTPYYLPEGGSETQLGGSAGIFEDTNSDGVYEQTTGDGIETPSVSTEGAVVGDTYYWASRYDGADADARLDAALSAATDGDTIYLEEAVYSADRTISNRLKIVGTGGAFSGSKIEATWTLGARVLLESVTIDNATVNVNSQNCAIMNSLGGSVTVSDGRFRYVANDGGDVTFESGTSSSIVDACVGTTVTDNGSNTVGDIS
jgi:hypothetical protein